jgi:hypothetical protein
MDLLQWTVGITLVLPYGMRTCGMLLHYLFYWLLDLHCGLACTAEKDKQRADPRASVLSSKPPSLSHSNRKVCRKEAQDGRLDPLPKKVTCWNGTCTYLFTCSDPPGTCLVSSRLSASHRTASSASSGANAPPSCKP